MHTYEAELKVDFGLVMYIGLYRKVVSYVLLHSGLGSPTDIAVVREATGIRYCDIINSQM